MTPAAFDRRAVRPSLAPSAVAARLCALACAGVALWSPLAQAQSQPAAQGDVSKEVKALKERLAELEKKVEAQQAQPASAGMTPEQQQDFNRIAVKTEALEDARDMSGFKGLKVSGYMDPTFIYSQRQHRAGFQFMNAVSDSPYTFDNSYMGIAMLDFIKETDSGSRWRLTLVPQRSTQAVAEGSNSPLHEASVSVPLTDLQTRFIAGHIPDWSGYEMLQATLTKTITHNLLFDTTLPASYTGAGMELAREKWLIKAIVANMAASKRQPNEKTPVLAYRVDYAKGEFQGFGFAGIHGRAANNGAYDADGERINNPATGQPYPTDSRVDTFEFDAYFIRGDFTAQGQVSFGRQVRASTMAAEDGSLRTAYWQGLSGLLAYKFEPRFEGVVRMDYIFNKRNGGGLLTYAAFDGDNGIGPGKQQDENGDWVDADRNKGVNRGALTVGCNYLFNLNTVLKLEYRYDWATGKVFENKKDGSYAKTNQLLSTAVVVSF
ncbi:MAG: hypothetical protein RI907_205 [Pseudomonadota bacterium]|jgi:hypothetical protein